MPKNANVRAIAVETAPESHGYDFGGPIGTSILTVFLPPLCYAFAYLCNDVSGCPAPSMLSPSTLTLAQLKREVGWPKDGILGLGSMRVAFWVLAYYMLSLTLFSFLPGQEVKGIALRSGSRLKYKMNGFNSAFLVLGATAIGTVIYGPAFPVWTFIWDNQVHILTTNLIISYLLATWVYVRSFQVKPRDPEHRELAEGGHTGNVIYDWFMGRELNPRVTLPLFGEVDIKAWCEMRPGLLGWLLMDLAFTAKQYALHGRVSDSMVVAVAAQMVYVLDALYMEPAILTTIDITTDGFGFMLAFGDLVWLPFVYSLQARYLAVFPVDLGLVGLAGVLSVLGAGYYIFRSTNNEKNRFRTNPEDPSVKHLKYIQTEAGSKLLYTGWWGRARHINYLGDWIMSWAYCLPTGLAGYLIRPHVSFPLGGNLTAREPAFALGSPAAMEAYQGPARGWGAVVTYFFMIYFAVLLVHRERRDEDKCSKKYGKDWEEYKRRVPYRIIPYVY